MFECRKVDLLPRKLQNCPGNDIIIIRHPNLLMDTKAPLTIVWHRHRPDGEMLLAIDFTISPGLAWIKSTLRLPRGICSKAAAENSSNRPVTPVLAQRITGTSSVRWSGRWSSSECLYAVRNAKHSCVCVWVCLLFFSALFVVLYILLFVRFKSGRVNWPQL